MKKLLQVLFIVVFLFVAGCDAETSKENEVKEFVTEYKTKQHTIEDPSNMPTGLEIIERIKPYLSEEEYEKLLVNRGLDYIPKVATNISASVEVQDVELTKTEDNEDGTTDYDFVLELKFYNEDFSEVVTKEGQLTIQEENGYKVTRDWEKPTQFEQDAISKKTKQ
ncbi:hypothetical protein [Ornithinibacillus scapharcae]|uniref:hypothetical protein n=1 Tax=Ornithinibacillus scapharcae TaxID=1147159 RepID=UPI000225B5DC|nr:hypothetical protein [Ornithinibacillus scapharcae]